MAHKLVFEASEVADFCDTDVATIYTWVKKGEISYFKTPGGRLRFKREAVLDFLRRYQFPIPAELATGRPRVAVILDDAAALEKVRRALARTFEVSAYADPCDALLALGAEKPDAVVLDVRVGALDGLHCVRRFRASALLAHARVVVFTADADAHAAALEAGAAAVVAAGASLDDLAARLKHLLGNR